ncbi:hypothetical protein MLD38_007846 [Melastoma candidum]|uniref:Uncharacterized protein n=1 Tax=Melastoma candidum TaxID=119954 RepID=A0ACB9RS36_9MYRT|nr:hypothetical protein MLD38_007846 [Melastoma candidum]
MDITTLNSSAVTVAQLEFRPSLLLRHREVALRLNVDRRSPFPVRRCPRASGKPPVAGARSVPDEAVVRSPAENLELKKKAMDISADLKGTSIFLVGMKCDVKEKIGKLLAELLRYYYFDSDGLVEEAAGGEASAKLYRETDEKGFLESETEVLKQLSAMGRLVVCAGDGAVQSSTNLALLRHGISIWVDIPIDRVLDGLIKDRPACQQPHSLSESEQNQLLTQLASIYEETRGGYDTADATISLQKVTLNQGYNDMSEVTDEDMTMEVLKEIGKLIRARKMMEEAGRPF